MRETIGRPPIETDQPGLLEAICDIVQGSSAADDKRRSEILRTTRTLSDLVGKLSDIGYILSRTTAYYRLMPSSVKTRDGRRHVRIVPVRLLRPERNLRKKNKDRMFAKSFCDDMKSLEKQFGPDALNYVSMDDKAKVPIGLHYKK